MSKITLTSDGVFCDESFDYYIEVKIKNGPIKFLLFKDNVNQELCGLIKEDIKLFMEKIYQRECKISIESSLRGKIPFIIFIKGNENKYKTIVRDSNSNFTLK